MSVNYFEKTAGESEGIVKLRKTDPQTSAAGPVRQDKPEGKQPETVSPACEPKTYGGRIGAFLFSERSVSVIQNG